MPDMGVAVWPTVQASSAEAALLRASLHLMCSSAEPCSADQDACC